ncbi:MAG: hypothetical protein U0946_00020 [Patescibacteria group bacterium]|nr:hypothetical protein [Patescibacteria group bacterium]
MKGVFMGIGTIERPQIEMPSEEEEEDGKTESIAGLRKELADLRKEEFSAGLEGISEKKQLRIKELAEQLKEADTGFKPLSAEEKEEYLQLTREQTESRDWDSEKAARLDELERRKEATE